MIERNRACAERAADALERTIVLHGDGLDVELLTEAGIERADAVLAVTDDDKTNLLAAVRAKASGCPMAICLVNDPTLIPLMEPLDDRRLHQPALHHVSARSCATSATAGCAASIPSATPRPR